MFSRALYAARSLRVGATSGARSSLMRQAATRNAVHIRHIRTSTALFEGDDAKAPLSKNIKPDPILDEMIEKHQDSVKNMDMPPLEGEEAIPEKVQAIVNQVEQLTMWEMTVLINSLQKVWGISDDMLAFSGGGGGGGAAEAAPAEEAKAEQTEFTVKLEKFEAKAKIKIIKEVRGITGLGLKEAKELVESAPCEVKTGLPKEEAEKLVKALNELGGEAKVE